MPACAAAEGRALWRSPTPAQFPKPPFTLSSLSRKAPRSALLTRISPWKAFAETFFSWAIAPGRSGVSKKAASSSRMRAKPHRTFLSGAEKLRRARANFPSTWPTCEARLHGGSNPMRVPRPQPRRRQPRPTGCAKSAGSTGPARSRRLNMSPAAGPRSGSCPIAGLLSPSDSSTKAAACNWSSMPRSAAESTRLGGWPCASVFAAHSTSNCRPPPRTTALSFRSASSTASRWRAFFVSSRRPLRVTCWNRPRCRLPCSPRAGDGTPPGRWPCRDFKPAGRCRPTLRGCAPKTCWPRCFPRHSGARRIFPAIFQFPIIPWSGKR